MDMATYASWTLCYNNRRHPVAVTCTIAQVLKCAPCSRRPFRIPCHDPSPMEVSSSPASQRSTEGTRRSDSSARRGTRGSMRPRGRRILRLSAHGKVAIKLKAFGAHPPFRRGAVEFRRIFEKTVSLPDGWRFKAAVPDGQRPQLVMVANYSAVGE